MRKSLKGWRGVLLLAALLVALFFMARWATGWAGMRLVRAMAPQIDSMARSGFDVTIIGDAPGAPRSAKLVVTGGSISGTLAGDTGLTVELRLTETLRDDSVGAWAGRCLQSSERRTFHVVTGVARDPSATARGLNIIGDGRLLFTLTGCAKETQ